MTESIITLFHNPQSRSAGVRVLLEALGAPYEVRFIDLKAGANRTPEFLALNPLGKLPTIRYRDAVVTEQVAIYIYLADLFPAAGLAPALDDPRRGPYLRWIAFYGSSFEPAVVDHAMKRPDIEASTAGYGSYDAMLKTLVEQLGRGDYLLGDRFSAADVLWGSALRWTTGFGIVPALPEIRAYIDRVAAHPAFARAAELDAGLMAEAAVS
ncbi:glutathione S-transferase family protein [Nannocystis bainbridge]|uniref:Glutathione S-transferase family protein n=1 Tax=Nannocystis bainbridge TaxID=2995303 RepID=A0ABT5EAM8_9BACT|nr:glutathione S-transferase family protein [Nannocystis bainbridge]MDC0722503.1 glutathione S-transferase family protein [Nannocystis bainbridge]